jgi:arginine-tRNA-protein transferase
MSITSSINEYFIADRVPAHVMDQVWALGWRHFGTYFFRYSRMQHGEAWQTVMPLRVRLENFQVSTSQRRVLKRNAALELLVQPARIDAEKQRLFALHRTRFTENIPPSLETFLHPEPAFIPCETLELCLYRYGRLIGAHFLDVGETATSSVYSIYDPDESRHSLGVYLILLAIGHSITLGKALYYPGYATLESSAYDYKKNLIGLERFDWHGRWLNLEP